ncbi:MAG: hypothetical protein F6K17_25865 [Okeania sp. SIO3C4]|nr:hypothetical protein [Okeania sp. SIO3C4]
MIQELINYTKHLREDVPKIFERNVEPSKGLHIFLELDETGKLKNWPPERGKDWDFFDGKEEVSPFLENALKYELCGQRIGNNMNKVLDKKKQIFSCSPFMVSFRKQSFEKKELEGVGAEKIIKLLDYYFDNAISVCLNKDEEALVEKAKAFKLTLKEILPKLDCLKRNVVNKEGEQLEEAVFAEMKKDFYVNLYFRNVELERFKEVHSRYLSKNLFNSSAYNSTKEVEPDTFGLSDFFNGMNAKKPFLEHKTASMFKGISGRIPATDTISLNDFSLLLRRKVLPKPLPVFVDKNEFRNGDEIIKIFTENDKLSYSQILKEFYSRNNHADRVLQNYYLLFFNYKAELEDFDFVSRFEYKLSKEMQIVDLFPLSKKETKDDVRLKTVFDFEREVVSKIFNGALVKAKGDEYTVKYFDEIKAEYVSGGDPVYQMVLKYRKAFYDYIYKSKKEALNYIMWDDILWNGIIAGLRSDKITDKGHSQELFIKQKLNIWFSLYNYFSTNDKRKNMSSLIPELTQKVKGVVDNDDTHFETEDEFAFGAGQLIFYLLFQSRVSEKTHALLEPFLNKPKADQLQVAISNQIAVYKHELTFGTKRFSRLAKEVLGYASKSSVKSLQRMVLAGYFTHCILLEKTENNND